ncbi:unnamed protein product, partial [Pylaiella littoralis]
MGSVELENVFENDVLGIGARASRGGRRPGTPCGGFVRAHWVSGDVCGRRELSGEAPLSRVGGGLGADVGQDSGILLVKPQLVATDQFVTAFTVAFNAAFGEWARDLAEE